MVKFTKLCIICILCAFAVSAQGRQTALSKDETALRALEKTRLAAFQEKDAATVGQQLADDYSLTFENGMVFNKAETLEMVRRRPEGRHLEWTEDTKARFYGDTAILTGRYLHDIRQPKRKIYALLYTDTYIKHKGHWYLASTHWSLSTGRQ